MVSGSGAPVGFFLVVMGFSARDGGSTVELNPRTSHMLVKCFTAQPYPVSP